MPSEVSGRVGVFDRFATATSKLVGRGAFFLFCVLMIVVWAPSVLVIGNVDTWQLIINTATTIITFLMVALLQNTESRANQAVQHKLNAIADGLADLMANQAGQTDGQALADDVRELRLAVGLEDTESSSKNSVAGSSERPGALATAHRP
jgi:hypothetical protein